MAEQKLPLTSRIADIATTTSLVTNILGPRSFTAPEAVLLAEGLLKLEGLLSSLCLYVKEHRTQSEAMGTYRDGYVLWHVLATDPAKSIVLGDFVLEGGEMLSSKATTAPGDARIGVTGGYTLKYEGTTVMVASLSSFAAHAMLRALPAALYHAMGSLLEELAAAGYKGTIPIGTFTSNEMAAFIRLQDKILKQEIESVAGTPIASATGILYGTEAVKGAQKAREVAEQLIRTLSPEIAEWLYDEAPLGERAYSPTGIV